MGPVTVCGGRGVPGTGVLSGIPVPPCQDTPFPLLTVSLESPRGADPPHHQNTLSPLTHISAPGSALPVKGHSGEDWPAGPVGPGKTSPLRGRLGKLRSVARTLNRSPHLSHVPPVRTVPLTASWHSIRAYSKQALGGTTSHRTRLMLDSGNSLAWGIQAGRRGEARGPTGPAAPDLGPPPTAHMHPPAAGGSAFGPDKDVQQNPSETSDYEHEFLSFFFFF